MDVDNDIDSLLLQQFSSMGTTDKEVLISQFQNLVAPNQLNAAACAFFLDMNNWNLQSAICSYYDFEQPIVKVPQMAFVKDITIGEGESVPPATDFVKTWRVMNPGDEVWPPGCSLKYVGGDQFCSIDRMMVEALQPGSVTDVSINMKSPEKTGIYQGRWRMSTPTGVFFGDIIWVIVQVEENGLLGLTQQLSQFGGEFTHIPQNNPNQNPFASPDKFGCVPNFSSPTPSVVTFPSSSPLTPSSDGKDVHQPHRLTLASSARAALFQCEEVTSCEEFASDPTPLPEAIPLRFDSEPIPAPLGAKPTSYEAKVVDSNVLLCEGQDSDMVDMT